MERERKDLEKGVGGILCGILVLFCAIYLNFIEIPSCVSNFEKAGASATLIAIGVLMIWDGKKCLSKLIELESKKAAQDSEEETRTKQEYYDPVKVAQRQRNRAIRMARNQIEEETRERKLELIEHFLQQIKNS